MCTSRRLCRRFATRNDDRRGRKEGDVCKIIHKKRLAVCVAAIVLCAVIPGSTIADTTSIPRTASPEIDRQVRRGADGTRSTLSFVEVDRFLRGVEADRLLLSEIRKEVPSARGEAEVFLARLKDLASRSDPVRLVPLVNRVLSNSAIYYDWLDGEFGDEEERIIEYYVGGARGFHFALETLKSAILLTAINRLDIAARIIRELDAENLD